MYALTAIGILAAIGGILWALNALNERTMRRCLAPYLARPKAGAELPDNLPAIFYGGPVARPGGAVRHSMRAYRSEVALAPVQWHDNGELLPALPEPPTVRIGGRPEPETPATSESYTPARTPTVESDFAVPALQAIATAIAAAICAGLLSWALGWSWRVPVVVLALTLAGAWLWRLGIADSLLWAVESFTGRDLTGDNHVGRPGLSFAIANPGVARAAVAKETRQTAEDAQRAALLAFVDKSFMVGTSESAQGIAAGDRADYLTCRDALLSLGVGRWKNPARPRAGWTMAVSRQRARQLVEKHTF